MPCKINLRLDQWTRMELLLIKSSFLKGEVRERRKMADISTATPDRVWQSPPLGASVTSSHSIRDEEKFLQAYSLLMHTINSSHLGNQEHVKDFHVLSHLWNMVCNQMQTLLHCYMGTPHPHNQYIHWGVCGYLCTHTPHIVPPS